jgi:hypothetical protein
MYGDFGMTAQRDRQRAYTAAAERHRMRSTPVDRPGLLQRMALRVASSGRRPAVVRGRTVGATTLVPVRP